MRSLLLAALMIAVASGVAGGYYYVEARRAAPPGPPTLAEGMGSGETADYVEIATSWLPTEDTLPYGYARLDDAVEDNAAAGAANPCLPGTGERALEEAGRVIGVSRRLALTDPSLAGPHQPQIVVGKVELFHTAEQAGAWLLREESGCRTDVDHAFEAAAGVGEEARAIRLTFNEEGANGYAVAFRTGPVLATVFGVNVGGGEVSPEVVTALAKDLDGRIRERFAQ